MFGRYSFSRVPVLTRFRSRQIKVPMESIKCRGGELISPFFEFRLGPIAVQANYILGKVLGKRQAVLAFANQDVANAASRRTIVDSPGRFSLVVQIDHEHFPVILKVRPEIPGLARL